MNKNKFQKIVEKLYKIARYCLNIGSYNDLDDLLAKSEEKQLKQYYQILLNKAISLVEQNVKHQDLTELLKYKTY